MIYETGMSLVVDERQTEKPRNEHRATLYICIQIGLVRAHYFSMIFSDMCSVTSVYARDCS